MKKGKVLLITFNPLRLNRRGNSGYWG